MRDYAKALAELETAHARRSLRFSPAAAGAYLELDGRRIVNLASNDYLGLARDPRLAAAAADAATRLGCGATASRLVSGNLALCDELETRLAADYGKAAALVYPTGYMANVGLISALAAEGDAVYCDKLDHASLYDGVKLSGATLVRYPHGDLARLERLLGEGAGFRHKYLVVDSLFSMDGDAADLPRLVDLARAHGVFTIVDEAHANGVFGARGLGLAEAAGTLERIDLVMGTFSKALGSLGGFIVSSRAVVDWLINKSRAFIYTTGLPPAVLAANLAALDAVRAEPGPRQALLAAAADLRARLAAAGFDLLGSTSQIIPVVVGGNAEALALADALLAEGFLAPAIRPPTVPPGSARLRLALSAAHAPADLARFVEVLVAAAERLGIRR